MSDDISALRATVIEKAINVEWLINAIISQNYFGRVKKPFLVEVLYDEYCTFALKRRILFKIRGELDNRFQNDIGRFNTIRNYFAHCGQKWSDAPEPDSPTRVPDPRNPENPIDFNALYQEFEILDDKITKKLFDVYKSMGGIVVE